MKSKSILACLFLISVFISGTWLRAQTRLVSLTDYLNVALQKNPLLRAAEQGKADDECRYRRQPGQNARGVEREVKDRYRRALGRFDAAMVDHFN